MDRISPDAGGGEKAGYNLAVVHHPAHAAQRGVRTAGVDLAQEAVGDAVEGLFVLGPAGESQHISGQQVSAAPRRSAIGVGVDDLEILAWHMEPDSAARIARLFAQIVARIEPADWSTGYGKDRAGREVSIDSEAGG